MVKMGLKNLSRRKARTALTVVGVIIGTISIVVMISVGIGMNTNFTKQIMELGSLTSITVSKYAYVQGADGNYTDKQQKMDAKLVEEIKKIEHVKAVSPMYQAYGSLYCKGFEGWAQIYAMDTSMMEAFDFPALTYGEYPTEGSFDTFILGAQTLERFQNPKNWNAPPIAADPAEDRLFFTLNISGFEVDWTIPPKQNPMKKIAVMEKTNGMDGYDYSCYMDIRLYEKYYSDFVKQNIKKVDQGKAMKALKEYGEIKINVDNVKNVSKVQKAIEEMGFISSSLTSVMEPTMKASNMLQLVLGCVGGISMLVSAISIANTMIMSIYERTKEIGVMKVLGCLVSDVKKLFLFEAGMIGIIGGLAGVALSYIASYFINKFGGPIFSSLISSGAMFGNTGVEEAVKYSIIPLWLPALAVAFAFTIGIISGYYPARRATRISAIEAMKSDG